MRSSALESEGLYPQTRKPDPSLLNLALGILLQAFRDIVVGHQHRDNILGVEGRLYGDDPLYDISIARADDDRHGLAFHGRLDQPGFRARHTHDPDFR